MFSNIRSVLSRCNTRLRLLHLLYDIEVMWQKNTIKHAFSHDVLYATCQPRVRSLQGISGRGLDVLTER